MRPAAHPMPTPSRREATLEEQKRSFLRMVSHELRTPLNSILGFSEILASELYGPLGSPQYKEYAEIIQGSGRKLLKLVNQVVEIARLEGQAMDFDLRAEPLDPALEEVLAGLGEDLEAHGTQVTVVGRGRLPAVTADPRGLRSVLTALLHNAVVHSPDGAEAVVRAARRGAVVQVEIENPGAPIAAEDLPRLLRPFEQGQTALTRPTEGVGLGLSICALTCQAMGGGLALTPGPQGGLIARVELPAA